MRRTFAGLSVVALAAFAGAPPARYSLDAERVTDAVTNLVWQRTPSAPMTFSEAQTYCAGASPTGWRLPTIKEAQTLVDYRAVPPAAAIDTVAFPSTPAEAFWSSTPVAASPGTVWVVDFATGSTVSGAAGMTARVRCVR